MSSEVGDPEARRGETQMGNLTRGSADVKSILEYTRLLQLGILGYSNTGLPDNYVYYRTLLDEYSFYRLRNCLNNGKC